MSIFERRRIGRMTNKMFSATAGARTLFEVAAAATSVLAAALHRANEAERQRCVAYADKRLRSMRPKPPRPPRQPLTKREEFERRQQLVAQRMQRRKT